MGDVARRLGRVLLEVFWPLRHADAFAGWWQIYVVVVGGLFAGAASFLSSSPFWIIFYVLLILLALTLAAAYRLQGRADVAYTRQELTDAKSALGRLISDAGDLLIARDDRPFSDQAFDIFEACISLFVDGSPVFDESHEGRLYAVSTSVIYKAADPVSEETIVESLKAQIACLNEFIAEINAELNSMRR